jgi:hypothetical protein
MTYDDVGESICPKAIGLSVRCARRDWVRQFGVCDIVSCRL